jgi:hypothetical protein
MEESEKGPMERGTATEYLDMDTAERKSLDDDSRYQLLQRILATPDFVRSPQLSKFLLYICTATFEGRGQTLSEQHVGVAVFGREPDYDSAADTIVRSHALRLRRRLEQYFQRAGRNELVHLVIPRGGYAPVFLPAPAFGESAFGQIEETPLPAPQDDFEERNPSIALSIAPGLSNVGVSSDELQRESSRDRKLPDARTSALLWRYRALTATLALLLVGLAVVFVMHLRTHFLTNRHHVLWGRLFTDDQPTHIVLGDSGLVLFHKETHQYVSLHDFLSDDVSKQLPFAEHADPEFAKFLLHRRYTSMVDAAALARLLRLPEAIPERTLVHYSKDMHLNDFKSGNVILLGAEEANPWVELFEQHMDFAFSIDTPDRRAYFVNRHPLPGEAAEYNPNTPESSTKVYAVFAFLPNLSATGNVLILEGLSMVGTESAVDLAMDDDRLLPILNKMRKPNGSLPHFEMLLESDALGESEGPARVVAIHPHD